MHCNSGLVRWQADAVGEPAAGRGDAGPPPGDCRHCRRRGRRLLPSIHYSIAPLIPVPVRTLSRQLPAYHAAGYVARTRARCYHWRRLPRRHIPRGPALPADEAVTEQATWIRRVYCPLPQTRQPRVPGTRFNSILTLAGRPVPCPGIPGHALGDLFLLAGGIPCLRHFQPCGSLVPPPPPHTIPLAI